MAGELNIQSTLSRATVPVMNVPQLVYCLLKLRPAEVASSGRQLPINLCLVLDRSGSMSGDKMDKLRDATSQVIDMLQPDDYISIIFFSSRVEVTFPSQPVGNDAHRAELKARVMRQEMGGGTNMAPAMEAGLQELRKQMSFGAGGTGSSSGAEMVNRLVLLTDGITEKEKRCLEQAEAAAKLNVPITALGIGSDWNDKLMEQIGKKSNGEADYISNPDKIRAHFTRAIQQMQAVALRHAMLRIRPALNIEVRAVYRAHPLISILNPDNAPDRTVLVPLGEIERGHGQTLIVELIVPSRSAGAYRIAQLEVEYDVPQTGLTGERAGVDVLLSYAHDASAVPLPDPQVMNLVEKTSAFKLQTRALQDVEAGNIPAATQKLRGALTHLLNQGDTELAATVEREIENLEKGRVMSSEGRKTIRFESGKTVRLGETPGA
jgi:Ca-activated chloride channel family protein